MFRPLLLTALLPFAAHAATAATSLGVSLTISESCRVERRERESAPPAVTCSLDSPYRVQPNDDKPAHPPKIERRPACWEVIF